jgi:hypothetical protein
VARLDLSWFRDLVIVVAGILFILGGIVFFILFIDLYGRLKKTISNSNELVTLLKDTTNVARETVTYARDRLIKPLIEVATFLQLIEKVVQSVKNFFCSIRGNKTADSSENTNSEPEAQDN